MVEVFVIILLIILLAAAFVRICWIEAGDYFKKCQESDGPTTPTIHFRRQGPTIVSIHNTSDIDYGDTTDTFYELNEVVNYGQDYNPELVISSAGSLETECIGSSIVYTVSEDITRWSGGGCDSGGGGASYDYGGGGGDYDSGGGCYSGGYDD